MWTLHFAFCTKTALCTISALNNKSAVSSMSVFCSNKHYHAKAAKLSWRSRLVKIVLDRSRYVKISQYR